MPVPNSREAWARTNSPGAEAWSVPRRDPEREADLCRELRAGNREEMGRLAEAYRTRLLALARRILGGEAEAEDVVQDALARLWANREELRDNGSAQALLFIMVRSIARDRVRWGNRRPTVPVDDLHAPLCESPMDLLLSQELDARVRAAVETLSERRREVFSLVRDRGLTHKEAAETLGLSPQTVSNTLAAALSSLREQLGPFLT